MTNSVLTAAWIKKVKMRWLGVGTSLMLVSFSHYYYVGNKHILCMHPPFVANAHLQIHPPHLQETTVLGSVSNVVTLLSGLRIFFRPHLLGTSSLTGHCKLSHSS